MSDLGDAVEKQGQYPLALGGSRVHSLRSARSGLGDVEF